MNPFRYHLLINLIGLVVGIVCPPLYFAGRRRFVVVLCVAALILMFGRYCWLGVGGLVLCSVIAQIRIDYKYRHVLTANAKDDRLYQYTAHL